MDGLLVILTTIPSGKPLYAKQSVAVTGFNSDSFAKAVSEYEKIYNLFDRCFPIDTLDKWVPSMMGATDYPVFEVSNRYFTKKAALSQDVVLELGQDIDPKGILKKIAGTDFVHTTENEVKYFKLTKDKDGDIEWAFIQNISFNLTIPKATL